MDSRITHGLNMCTPTNPWSKAWLTHLWWASLVKSNKDELLCSKKIQAQHLQKSGNCQSSTSIVAHRNHNQPSCRLGWADMIEQSLHARNGSILCTPRILHGSMSKPRTWAQAKLIKSHMHVVMNHMPNFRIAALHITHAQHAQKISWRHLLKISEMKHSWWNFKGTMCRKHDGSTGKITPRSHTCIHTAIQWLIQRHGIWNHHMDA